MPQRSRHHPRLDPRQPLVLDTRELGRRPGSMRAVHRTVPAPAGMRVELVGVTEGTPVELAVRLEAVVEGVLVSGEVGTVVSGECGRCLEPVSDALRVEVQELFVYPDSTTDETTEDDEVSRLVGDLLDLEPVVRDAIVLALPLAPLCRPDCPGLCAGCGMRWDQLPADHSHERLDPRWAALAERFDTAASLPDPATQDMPTHSSGAPAFGSGDPVRTVGAADATQSQER